MDLAQPKKIICFMRAIKHTWRIERTSRASQVEYAQLFANTPTDLVISSHQFTGAFKSPVFVLADSVWGGGEDSLAKRQDSSN